MGGKETIHVLNYYLCFNNMGTEAQKERDVFKAMKMGSEDTRSPVNKPIGC